MGTPHSRDTERTSQNRCKRRDTNTNGCAVARKDRRRVSVPVPPALGMVVVVVPPGTHLTGGSLVPLLTSVLATWAFTRRKGRRS